MPALNAGTRVNWNLLAGTLVIFVVVWLIDRREKVKFDKWNEVEKWLSGNELFDLSDSLYSTGIRCLEDVQKAKFLSEDRFDKLSSFDRIRLHTSSRGLRKQYQLFKWLEDLHLEVFKTEILQMGITSLKELVELSDDQLMSIASTSTSIELRDLLLSEVSSVDTDMTSQKARKQVNNIGVVILLLIVLVISFLGVKVYSVIQYIHDTYQSYVRHVDSTNLLNFITGRYLEPLKTCIEWGWDGTPVVGKTLTFELKFYQLNCRPYPIRESDKVVIDVTVGNASIPILTTYPSHKPEQDASDSNLLKVTLPVRKSGTYKISVRAQDQHIPGSPFTHTIKPGPLDPRKTSFVNNSSVVTTMVGVDCSINLQPRDEFGNVCEACEPSSTYSLTMTESNSSSSFSPEIIASLEPVHHYISLHFLLDQEGCYSVEARHNDILLKNGKFHILVLSASDDSAVSDAVSKKSHNMYFETRLLASNGTRYDKPKKVYCYISPKQLTIKEFRFRVFPKTLFAFRVCPSTKFRFLGVNNMYQSPVLVIDDGCQAPVEIALKQRNVVTAIFTQFLLKNIGGSETFLQKQSFFYQKIRQLHAKRSNSQLSLKVNRRNLFESSYRATKSFSTSDWCRTFMVSFQGEEGLDYGGVRREWLELLCQHLFDPQQTGLFTSFHDSPQALVHPNHSSPPQYKLKHYEFAGKIVGKCLYESAVSARSRQLVKARFTRSFLSQLIGLRVNHKFFEQDDPELYKSKVKYILENDVADMDLLFEEEEYRHGSLSEIIELIPNGSSTAVTEENKSEYLDALARHRLSARVTHQVEAFLTGLNELIPDNLLIMFDENELELLMCGTSDYSVEDLKKHHKIGGMCFYFDQKIVDWFWLVVSGFSQEELGRLLQFTTGSSLLPSGGFSQLTPTFEIVASPRHNKLPTAHTCFNQLCLPSYDSLEEMQHALTLAITEGNQGFGMI